MILKKQAKLSKNNSYLDIQTIIQIFFFQLTKEVRKVGAKSLENQSRFLKGEKYFPCPKNPNFDTKIGL